MADDVHASAGPDRNRENSPSAPGWAAWCSLGFIRLYQATLSPFIGRGCRFQPSCSKYTYEAISRYGFWRGWIMGCYRILRCNPFNRGGHDPVP